MAFPKGEIFHDGGSGERFSSIKPKPLYNYNLWCDPVETDLMNQVSCTQVTFNSAWENRNPLQQSFQLPVYEPIMQISCHHYEAVKLDA